MQDENHDQHTAYGAGLHASAVSSLALGVLSAPGKAECEAQRQMAYRAVSTHANIRYLPKTIITIPNMEILSTSHLRRLHVGSLYLGTSDP